MLSNFTSGTLADRQSVEYDFPTSRVISYMTNQLDFMMTYFTVIYCYSLAMFNVFLFNDGGQTLYDCFDANVKPIIYG